MNTASAGFVGGIVLLLPLIGILTEPTFFIPTWGLGILIGWLVAKLVVGKGSKSKIILIIVIAYLIEIGAGLVFWKLTGARLS